MDHDEFMSKSNQEGYVPEAPAGDFEGIAAPEISSIDEKKAVTTEGEKSAWRVRLQAGGEF